MAGVDSKLVLNRVSIRVDLPMPVSPGGGERGGGVSEESVTLSVESGP